jgi:hypothetical protein
MKKKIEDMISTLRTDNYDNEIVHSQYDDLLEEFILNYDFNLMPLMQELISLDKEFWYA